jgi:NAD+ synthase (glutamine-hydrolysing)
MGESCPFKEVNVTPIVVDIGAIKTKGIGDINNMKETANLDRSIPELLIDFTLCCRDDCFTNEASKLPQPFKIKTEIEQSLDALCLYIWDYLKKSGAAGFLLPLSGGADSGLTSGIIYHFAHKVIDYLTNRGEGTRTEILGHLRKIVRDEKFDPKTPEEVVSKIFYTRYMGTNNSSQETKNRAAKLAEQIGANHQSVNISGICDNFKVLIKNTMNMDPKFKSEGGNWRTDIALQNI